MPKSGGKGSPGFLTAEEIDELKKEHKETDAENRMGSGNRLGGEPGTSAAATLTDQIKCVARVL